MVQDGMLPKGALVQVRCAQGRSADDMVWEDLGDVVMVCGPEQFARLSGGYEAPMPIGFKREDVAPRSLIQHVKET